MADTYLNSDVLYFPKDAVLQAVSCYDTPFFLYEEHRIHANLRRLKQAFAMHFKKFVPLYAAKANSNPDVLKIVLSEGFGFDCSSDSEIWIAKHLGATGMFTGNYNPPEELASAKDAGLILNLDDMSQISFLEKIGAPEVLSFRINPGIGKGDMQSNILAGPDAKFGVPHEKAPAAYREAKFLGVKKFGIHMMTGSNILDENYFPAVVEKLFEVMARVKKEAGIEIDMMNIGGGFGVPYRPGEKSLNVEKIAADMRAVFDRKCGEYGLSEPTLLIEPGRFVVADAGWLVAKVLAIKDGYKKFVGIDASCNDMPRPSIYGAYHHISTLTSNKVEETVSVVGRICENNDQFAKDRSLIVPSPGDVVVIHNCGGHAYSMGHNYNGRLKHAEYLLCEDGNIRIIRPAQTFEDLYKGTNL